MKTTLALVWTVALLCVGCASSPTPPPSRPIPTAPLPDTPAAAGPTETHGIPLITEAAPEVTRRLSPIPSVSPSSPLGPNALAVKARLNLFPLPGIGRAPVALAQLGSEWYVANRSTDNLAVVVDRRVTKYISTPQAPIALAVDRAKSRLYAATELSRTVSLVQNGSIVATTKLSDTIMSLALYGGDLFVGYGSSATIQIVDSDTLQPKGQVRLDRGSDVNALIVDAPRHRLYAAPYGAIVALDLDTLREMFSLPVPYVNGSLAVNPLDGSSWAGSYDDQYGKSVLIAYDLNGRELLRIPLGGDLGQAAFDSTGNLYVADSYLNRIYIIQAKGGRLLATIPVGLGPAALALDEASRLLLVANRLSDNVSLVDTGEMKVMGVIPLAMNIKSLLANQDRDRIYVASASTDSVFVVEGDRLASQVSVGRSPVDLARDPNSERLFVANSSDGTISVVDERSLTVQATLPVTFNLTTVAVDPAYNHLFAGSMVFTLDSLKPELVYQAHSASYDTSAPAEFVRVSPAGGKLYAFAYNGIPGSNSRTVLYTFDEANLAASHVLANRNGGNVTAMAFDSNTQRVYAAFTHPLSFANALDVWDADENNLAELVLPATTFGIAFNPHTNHVFLSHSHTYSLRGTGLTDRDNTVQILDSRSLGEVAWLQIPGGPGPSGVLGDTVYVAGMDDGVLNLIDDRITTEPPAPTATFTPTPYRTWTPTSVAVRLPLIAFFSDTK